MTWITGEYPVSDDAWPERMASMAPASICAMARRSVVVVVVWVVGARPRRRRKLNLEHTGANCETILAPDE